MCESIFLTSSNEYSKRTAIFEDNGISGWLYLTCPNDNKIIRDCWIYNRISAPDFFEISKYKNGPPPASVEYAGENSCMQDPFEEGFHFKWSPDGNAVALLFENTPLGYITLKNEKGYSKNLVKPGPWGDLLNQKDYEELFN